MSATPITDELTLDVLRKIVADKERAEKFNQDRRDKQTKRQEAIKSFTDIYNNAIKYNEKNLEVALKIHHKMVKIDYNQLSPHIKILKDNLENIENMNRMIAVNKWRIENADLYFPIDYPETWNH